MQRSTPDLAEIVYQHLSKEPGLHGILSAALPPTQEGYRTTHELDYADFALTVGVAYGIARGEDPYETGRSVKARVVEAAPIAFNRWGSWEVTLDQDRAQRPVPADHPDAPDAQDEVA